MSNGPINAFNVPVLCFVYKDTHTHLPVEVADLNNNKYFLYVFLLHDVNKLSKLNYWQSELLFLQLVSLINTL